MRRPVIVLIAWLTCGFSGVAGAAGLTGGPLRDYSVPYFLAPHQVEVSADYLVMNSTVDIFNFRDSELSSVSSDLRTASMGDLNGGRLLVNYGFLDRTNLRAEYLYRDIDMGLANFKIHSGELALRQGLALPHVPEFLTLAVEGGARGSLAEDIDFNQISDINRYVRKIEPGTSISETGSHVVFTTPDGSVYSPKAGKAPLDVTLKDMNDQTVFFRLLLGLKPAVLTPSLFLEYGHTWIDTCIDSNVATFVGGSLAEYLTGDFPVDLSRSENYWKGGVHISWQVLHSVTAQAAYEYLRMQRGSGLDASDDNHIVKADLTWEVTPSLGLNLGGVYYRHQFNGVIPFLYNRYSQNSFDHEYGVLNIGLIGKWGGS